MKKFIVILFTLYNIHSMAQTDSAQAVAEIMSFQQELNDSYANKDESPLDAEDFDAFTEHEFFPINLAYRVNAKLTVTPGMPILHLKTSTDRLTNDRIYGFAEFTLGGKNFKLPVYQSAERVKNPEYADHLFFPFSDLTNGKQTYGGGRYIDLSIPKDNSPYIIIDFNKAYNPYCAYSHRYSCPKVPEENQMDIEVPVGILHSESVLLPIKVKPNEIINAYFDKNWKEIKRSEGAAFYRIIEGQDSSFIVKDYFRSGKIQMVAVCSSIKPELFFEGQADWYFENGTLKEQAFYTNNKKTGVSKSYHRSGKPKSEIFHTKEKTIYRHFWSEAGVDLLQNGAGIIQEDSRSKHYTEIKDSTMIASFSIKGNDSIYGFVQKRAEYKGGDQALYKDLSAALKYPKRARRNGREGKVFIQFTIDKKGDFKNVNVIRGFDPDCDQAALDAVSKLGKWNPAMHKNKPVQSGFILPVRFKF
jgi:TonB family protein